MTAISHQTPLGWVAQGRIILRPICVHSALLKNEGRAVGVRKFLTPSGRRLQRSLPGLNFWQKRTREPTWVNNQYEPIRVAQSPILESQTQRGLQESPEPLFLCSSVQCDELQRLCDQGHLDRAFKVLLRMDQQGTVPSVKMYSSVLKACIRKRSLGHANRVHALLTKHGLQCNVFLGEYLVSVLVECGGLEDALQIFYGLPYRTVFSWTSVISAYSMSGQGHRALKMYVRMREEGVQPNAYTFVSLLKACGSMADLEYGKHIHAEASKYGCESNVFVQTCLLDMYAKCGSIGDALSVFDSLTYRHVVTWTAMLAAFNHQGQPQRALQLYEQMLEEGIDPDDRAFVVVLQACSRLAEQEENDVVNGSWEGMKHLGCGKVLHAEAWRKGYESDVFVGNSLVCMYSRCRSVVDAQRIFQNLAQCDIVSWTAILGAYAKQRDEEKTWQLYEIMLEEGVSSNARTLVSVLQACSVLAELGDKVLVAGQSVETISLQKGKVLHANAWRKGYDSDVFFGNTLVSMYGKCGSILDAQDVFDGLPDRDVVSWTVLMSAYVQQGQGEKALQVYIDIREEGVCPDNRTFVSALQACSMLAKVGNDAESNKPKLLDMGKALHADAWRMGYRSDVFIVSSLICMYGECGSIVDAHNVFGSLADRSLIAWNAILAVHVENGQAEEALQLYTEMQQRCIMPNDITVVCVLQACSHTGSLDVCRQIHHTLAVMGYELTLPVANTLIHAYGRCASMVDAQAMFDVLPQADVVSWTALIAAYAREGNSMSSFDCYKKMIRAGMHPNKVTFLSLLSACSHAGLVDQGVEYFESMIRDHGIDPEIEHYACMVDILGRAGYLTNAKQLVLTMPMKPNLVIWLCLMCACRKYGKVALGKEAFNCAVHLQPEHGAAYILMADIYADAGLWDCATAVQEKRRNAGAWKTPGTSWIEHEQKIHFFMAADKKHFSEDELYSYTAACY